MSADRFGRHDPFEDTGDWPYREAEEPPPHPSPEPEAEAPYGSPPPRPDEAPETDVEEARPEDIELELGLEPDPVAESPPAGGPELEGVEAAAAAEPVVEAEEAGAEEPKGEEPPAEIAEHAAGGLRIPEGHTVLEGAPNGFRRTVAIVVSRFNGDITNHLLEGAIEVLEDAHVSKDAITVVPVPGAFELPLAAMALAKTRRYSCVVALGCVIRGETPHFDFVAGEAASGLQLAAIETGIPVSFGVLTCENREQAEARVGRGADAARAALEMADLFSQLRTRAAAAR